MRRFVYLLIAAVLLAQQGLALHGLSHGLESLKVAKQGQTEPRGLPTDRQCDLCLTYSQVASGAVATPLALPPHAVAPAATFTSLESLGAAPVRAFHSRAPPRTA